MPCFPAVGWFGNSQGERIAELERLISALTARVVKAEATAADCAERAYRYMKKAEARSRRELDESGPEARAMGAAPIGATGTPSSSRREVPWGARGRRWIRAHRPAPTPTNGDGE